MHTGKTLVGATLALAVVLLGSGPSSAQDASWGCKVLLCVANPAGWESVSYCVPPVEAAIREVTHGGSWPTCAEGGSSSGVNYDPYLPCPASTVTNGETCDKQEWVTTGYGKDERPSWQTVSLPRPRRAKPYSITISPLSAAPVTIWFSL